MKKALKTQLTAAVAMMVVAAIALTGATYAWFTAIANPDVNQIDLTVRAADTLMLSELADPQVNNVADWKVTVSQANIAAVQDTAFPTSLMNVSTLFNGTSSSFYSALFNTQGAINGYSAAAQDTNYAKFSLFVKSTNTGYIYLDSNSLVTPGDDSAPKASISQAVRIGFVPVSGGDEQWANAVIWEPNSVGHLSTTYGGPGGTGKLTYNGVNAAVAAPGATEDLAAALSAATSYDFVTDKTNVTGDATKIALFDYLSVDTAQKFNVYIWVEGGDADTVNAVAKSAFSTYLRFGQEKGTNLS